MKSINKGNLVLINKEANSFSEDVTAVGLVVDTRYSDEWGTSSVVTTKEVCILWIKHSRDEWENQTYWCRENLLASDNPDVEIR